MANAAAQLTSEFSGLVIANYCIFSSAALVLYEHAITLDQEVALFWKGKLNGAAILFYLNRYVYTVYSILRFPESSTTLASLCFLLLTGIASCTPLTRALFAMVAFGYCTWAAFAALRAFALSRNWFLSTVIFVLSIGTVAINLARSGYGLSGVNFPRIGCVVANPALDETIKRLFTILSRGCLMSADVLLIYITWSRLPTTFARGTDLEKRSFASILRRDGTMYFIVLLLMNSLHLTVTLLALQPAFEGTSYVTVFTEPITAILVSRFLLDLQSVERTTLGHADTSTDTGTSGAAGDGSLVFRFMGSLASTIDPNAQQTSSSGTDDFDSVQHSSDLASGEPEKLDEGSIIEEQRVANDITYFNA